jgi:hypothetical protein
VANPTGNNQYGKGNRLLGETSSIEPTYSEIGINKKQAHQWQAGKLLKAMDKNTGTRGNLRVVTRRNRPKKYHLPIPRWVSTSETRTRGKQLLVCKGFDYSQKLRIVVYKRTFGGGKGD